jgi:hypothetical protein
MNEQTETNFNTFCDFVRTLLGPVNYDLEIEMGRKYMKLIMKSGPSHSSVWGFVDKTTGEIYKPATWRAPAKHARGNVADPVTYQNYQWTGPHYLRGG